MKGSLLSNTPPKSDPKLLANLLDRHLTSRRIWSDDECGAIFRHQIRSPISFELSGLDPTDAAKLRHLAAARDLLLTSFNDLFLHPSPPLELLRMTKEYAKASTVHPASGLPEDVAKALYILSIAVARLRCDVMISELSDAALEKGIRWVIQRAWVDDALRQLLNEALGTLRSMGGAK